MMKFMSGLIALAWLVTATPMVAQAGTGLLPFKPGTVKSAIAKGETILLFYKSTY